MNHHDIAARLEEMSALLELSGANPFRVRAYANAAREMENLAEDLGALVEEGRLTEIPGIGQGLARHIAEMVRTGACAEHEALRHAVPAGLLEMLRVPGLGPARARFIWKELGITSLGELETACRRHMLSPARGFGEKTERNILAGIESLRRFAGKRLFPEALAAALDIHAEVRRWPEVIRSEICGSLRRRREVIGDIDLVVATSKPERAMQRFVQLAAVQRVLQRGPTKSEVLLASGLQCDLRAVSDTWFPFALHHFTGSKEHNVAMRARAKRMGLKLSEYGFFRGSSKRSRAVRDEGQLFEALRLPFIEPELREGMGEIEAAEKGQLPNLVKPKDLRGVLHVHSTFTDGTASIEEMARAAIQHGYRYLAVCDHSRSLTLVHGLDRRRAAAQGREIDALNRRITGFRVLKGIEVDILPDGTLDLDDATLATFDVVIAAVHSRFGMPEKAMTARIVKALSHPLVDILAHPTGRLLLAREPYAVNLRAVIETAARCNTAIEINAHPQRLDLDWRWCRFAKELGVKFAIDPDAHAPEGIDDIAFGVGVARKGWLEKGDVLNALTADELLDSLRRRRLIL